MSKLQAPDKKALGLLSICPSGEHHKLSMLAAKTGCKEVNQSADAVGGWIEGDGRVKAIVLARLKVVENFSKPSESGSGLAA